MAALIEKATGVAPFFVGKPNPYMMRSALNFLGAHSEETVMIGDRMDTDIVGAVSSGLDTVLVLTGVTQREHIAVYPYQPTYISESIGDVQLPEIKERKRAATAAAARREDKKVSEE
jgi:NagD protein